MCDTPYLVDPRVFEPKSRRLPINWLEFAMASWNIGINDVSEETQAFRNRLSSKGVKAPPSQHLLWLTFSDSQIAAQETQLMKQAAELEEFKLNLNETLHKVCLLYTSPSYFVTSYLPAAKPRSRACAPT
jgi:hypothetical protein